MRDREAPAVLRWEHVQGDFREDGVAGMSGRAGERPELLPRGIEMAPEWVEKVGVHLQSQEAAPSAPSQDPPVLPGNCPPPSRPGHQHIGKTWAGPHRRNAGRL